MSVRGLSDRWSLTGSNVTDRRSLGNRPPVAYAQRVVSFVRAHSPEQREVRRTAILDTATAMLNEMPATDITLNGLSRRTCMAKSNVLRYFESREAVLLELCADAMTEWVDALTEALAAGIDAAGSVPTRSAALTRIITSTLAERPILCDLISVQASVLEHNVSTETVLRFKHASIGNVERLSELVVQHLPELSAEDAAKFTAIAAMLAASVWVHSHPPAAVEAAYEADDTLRPYRMDFTVALPDVLDTALAGLISQQARRRPAR